MRISDGSSDVCSSDLEFLGYDALTAGGLEVVALLREGRPVDSIETGDEAVVFLDRTPFYAESGGQVGDTGELDEQGVRFAVADTQKYAGQFHGHVGKLAAGRSEEHTSELQSLMRISYAVFCVKKKKQ